MARYQITTPEQVSFHYETAGLMSRAMAWTVDQALITVFRVAIYIVLLRAQAQLGGTGGPATEGMISATLLLLVFLLDFGYFLYFELYWAGQSPGKRLFHLRVISARGGRLDFSITLIRNLLRPLDTLPFCMLTGGVAAFFDPLHRRLGDLAAETLVVRDSKAVLPQGALSQQARINSYQTDAAIRNRILARVTREERDLILDLMLRRDQLAQEVREELFSRTAGFLKKRYSLPEELEHLSEEQTVINLALVIQNQEFSH